MTIDAVPARLPVALLGAGAVGRMHAERLQAHAEVMLSGVADPGDAARAFALSLGVPWSADPAELLDRVRPAAAIVATPNATHLDVAMCCIERRIPVLVEKPIADTVDAGLALCRAAQAAGVPVMVGHQRRHNPIAREARRIVASGAIGRPVAASAMATWLKPDAYFDAAWRRQRGGGPVLINLIHDVDLLRFVLGGEVTQVQARGSNAQRGFEVEDTAAAVLQFDQGAIATLITSDSAVAPWNWDLAAGEAAHYARQDVDSHWLCGSDGSLTLPRLALWRYQGARGWHEPLTEQRTALHTRDPYVLQLSHLRAVAEGREVPLCSGHDGLRTLQATAAILEAAACGSTVMLDRLAL